jgi:hypothetical protein
MRNHKSNLSKDHNNEINVLPQLAAPSIFCSNFTEVKQSKHTILIRCLSNHPKRYVVRYRDSHYTLLSHLFVVKVPYYYFDEKIIVQIFANSNNKTNKIV